MGSHCQGVLSAVLHGQTCMCLLACPRASPKAASTDNAGPLLGAYAQCSGQMMVRSNTARTCETPASVLHEQLHRRAALQGCPLRRSTAAHGTSACSRGQFHYDSLSPRPTQQLPARVDPTSAGCCWFGRRKEPLRPSRRLSSSCTSSREGSTKPLASAAWRRNAAGHTVMQAELEALTRPQSPPSRLTLVLGCACRMLGGGERVCRVTGVRCAGSRPTLAEA